ELRRPALMGAAVDELDHDVAVLVQQLRLARRRRRRKARALRLEPDLAFARGRGLQKDAGHAFVRVAERGVLQNVGRLVSPAPTSVDGELQDAKARPRKTVVDTERKLRRPRRIADVFFVYGSAVPSPDQQILRLVGTVFEDQPARARTFALGLRSRRTRAGLFDHAGDIDDLGL